MMLYNKYILFFLLKKCLIYKKYQANSEINNPKFK